MIVSLIGYLFVLALGVWGAATAAQLVAAGVLTASLDNLFLTLFSALMAVLSFGYLAWRFNPSRLAPAGAAAGDGVAAAEPYVLPEDPAYEDTHIPLFNKIWMGLLLLTLIEVVLAYVQVAGVLVMLAILLLLSVVKAGMIMGWFMHLKFDHPAFSWVVVAPAVACILIMCGYFFPDSFRLLELGF